MHGKSSCTSLCAQIFIDAETDPTVLSGAEMTLMGGACRIGGKEHFLFEACEYMDSFLDFNPTVAVILNIEMDHVDYFHSIEQIRDSFAAFADRTGPDGTVIANWDDENVRLALQNYPGRIVTFSLNDPTAEFSVRDLTTVQGHPHFTVLHRGEPLLETTMAVFGSFHAYNALAATAATTLCGIPPHKIAASLARFPGAKRRMELLGQVNGAPVYDDYAHHPTEVAATVRAMRPAAQGRLVTLFQPHTYSRTRELWNEYRTAFHSADEILLLDVYAAREQPDPVVDLDRLADEINGLEGRTCARHWSDYGEVAAHLTETLQPGDLCVVMGAGNVFRLYPMLPLQEVCQ
jgi:UDP-N-acetylmuramate--alanine ligase